MPGINLSRTSLGWLRLLNVPIILSSVLLCCILLLLRLPGMELIDNSPNWLLIWVVVWSVKRTIWQGAIAGIAIGLIHDAMTNPHPSHAISLALVGTLTAGLRKQRYVQEDFITIALIVLVMVIVKETTLALQHSLLFIRPLETIWENYQREVVSSAIISSLWAPVLYYPLNSWWKNLRKIERQKTRAKRMNLKGF